MPRFQLGDTGALSDFEYQQYILQGVSRTFALTIPRLPSALIPAVGNAYLLCRIADTIEDDDGMSLAQKQGLAADFIRTIQGTMVAEDFSVGMLPLLSQTTPAAERDLVKNCARVIAVTQSLSDEQQQVISGCVQAMAEGMVYFQAHQPKHGLPNLTELNSYCYQVAGVVGEMLTLLYAQYCPQIAAQKEHMLRLSVSFGQALQMTNILKDIWADSARGVCWLPQDIFAEHGVDLARWQSMHGTQAFSEAFSVLIAITRGHLERALEYCFLVPRSEKGLREFCLLAIYMASLTLANMQLNPKFKAGSEVKISRTKVRLLSLGTKLTVKSDSLINTLYRKVTTSLPAPIYTELKPEDYKKTGYLTA